MFYYEMTLDNSTSYGNYYSGKITPVLLIKRSFQNSEGLIKHVALPNARTTFKSRGRPVYPAGL